MLGFIAALAVAAGPVAAQATPPPPTTAGAACPQYSFSRTFTNLTGKTVQGLYLSIHGPQEVGGFVTGPDNPFGEPIFHGLGPDGTYRVRFGGASVAPGQTVRVAFCIDKPQSDLVPLGSSFAQYWVTEGTADDEEVEAAPEQHLPAVGARWSPRAGGAGFFQIDVELTNAEPNEVQLVSLQWTRLDQPLPASELTWERLDTVAAWQTLGATAALPASPHEAGPSRTPFPLPSSFRFDEPGTLLFRFVAADPGSADNTVRGVSQVPIAALLRPVFLESRALEVASGRLAVPASTLTVLHSSEGEYPLQGRTVYPFKIGSTGGSMVEVVLDAAGGELDR